MSGSNLPANPADIGQLANAAAAASAFARYKQRVSDGTIDAPKYSPALFEQCCSEKRLKVSGLADGGEGWRRITHGLVSGFERWLLNDGYAINSVNLRVGHVRKYAGLAFEAGFIDENNAAKIALIKGIKGKTKANIDQKREMKRKPKTKKAEFNALTKQQFYKLLDSRPPTPRGRRDALILTLGAYMGLRVSEMVILTRDDINLEKGAVKIYAPKTDTVRLMKIKHDRCRACLYAYLQMDAPQDGPIFKASEFIKGNKASDKLVDRPMTRFDVFYAVKRMGKDLGVKNLSPHDLRHTGATWIAETTRNMQTLKSWGGWSNYNTAGKYVKEQEYANEDVNME